VESRSDWCKMGMEKVQGCEHARVWGCQLVEVSFCWLLSVGMSTCGSVILMVAKCGIYNYYHIWKLERLIPLVLT